MSDERERMADVMRQLVLSERYKEWTWEEIADALIAAGFGDVAQCRRETLRYYAYPTSEGRWSIPSEAVQSAVDAFRKNHGPHGWLESMNAAISHALRTIIASEPAQECSHSGPWVKTVDHKTICARCGAEPAQEAGGEPIKNCPECKTPYDCELHERCFYGIA